MHLLIFFANEDKIRRPEDIAHMIRADIPDPVLEPELHKIITTTMLHNCDSRCQINGKCAKGFPKPFKEELTMTEDGYPQYARPNNGRFFQKHQNSTPLT